MSYFHRVVCAVIVAPGHKRVIPLKPEFITTQDGDEKQDYEQKAAKRWINNNAKRYQILQPIYLTMIYSPKNPCVACSLSKALIFCSWPNQARTANCMIIFMVCRYNGKRVVHRKPSGRSETRIYRWVSGMPIRYHEDALQVNWFSMHIIRNKDQKITYHKEHNLRHGEHGISNLLLTLNLVAFVFHAVCDQTSELWHRFTTFEIFNNYQFFENWQNLLHFVGNPRSPP